MCLQVKFKIAQKITNPIYLVLLSLTLSACGEQLSLERALNSEKAQTELKFVQTVLLTNEYGGNGRVTRYTKSARVSAFRATASEKQVLVKSLQKINNALEGTSMSLTLIDDRDPSAEIRVYFARMKEFTAIASVEGFPYSEGNSGYFWNFCGNRNEIARSVVMLANNVLFGEELESVTLEELTQSLGTTGDQNKIKESIFFETPWNPGLLTELSALDAQTLRFLYTSVLPGDGMLELIQAFNLTWSN